mmetsp:Transcript_4647/g.16052  ORF Transcript_4647/g.16052 Transcript_4647/m.16052 type:complete len:235 (+) Transcript_4647:1168-1872(+)
MNTCSASTSPPSCSRLNGTEMLVFPRSAGGRHDSLKWRATRRGLSSSTEEECIRHCSISFIDGMRSTAASISARGTTAARFGTGTTSLLSTMTAGAAAASSASCAAPAVRADAATEDDGGEGVGESAGSVPTSSAKSSGFMNMNAKKKPASSMCSFSCRNRSSSLEDSRLESVAPKTTVITTMTSDADRNKLVRDCDRTFELAPLARRPVIVHEQLSRPEQLAQCPKILASYSP